MSEIRTKAEPALKVETLRWNDNALEMIDQRKLPGEFTYVSCTDAVAVATAIKSMVIRGAPAIGVAAAYGVALQAIRSQSLPKVKFQHAVAEGMQVLSDSRPTAVNLFWALQKMQQELALHQNLNSEQSALRLLEKARQMHSEDIRINRVMGSHGVDLLPEKARVLTHCNAGALATAGYGTALGVIRAAVSQGKAIEVVVNETRPFLQGARLTAWEMVEEKIPVTLITDSMAGYLMKNGEIDAVIVGADRVAINGDTANKIGTYMLAVLASHHRIPFYVVCPTSTIDPNARSGTDIPIEERDSKEVTGYGRECWAAEGVKVRNPTFDVTPAGLITALVTENGVLSDLNSEKIQKLLKVES